MNLFEVIHDTYVFRRRSERICAALLEMLPPGAKTKVLDVGCGSGLCAYLMGQERSDLELTGCEVEVRPRPYIATVKFDGKQLPFTDRSFDVVIFVDVLHHVEDPAALLKEAMRVGRGTIIVKDHILRGVLSRRILRFMDRVGNERYGVISRDGYQTKAQWLAMFRSLGFDVLAWDESLRPHLPFLSFEWAAGGPLHFVAKLKIPEVKRTG